MTLLELWRRKLDFLQGEQAVASSPDVRFQLNESIRECLAKIRELENKPPDIEDKPKRKWESSCFIGQDHQYNGELVVLTLNFHEFNLQNRQVSIILDISFGEVDEIVTYPDGESGYIRFGVKHGKLYLNLKNGLMPLHQRDFRNDSQGEWQIGTTGIEQSPVWEFAANSQSSILKGVRSDKKLGIIDVPDVSRAIMVEAVFRVQINSNDLEITAQDGAWSSGENPLKVFAKRRAFFERVVKPKLERYISKVVLQYDPTPIP
jgi:hypothetical protein